MTLEYDADESTLIATDSDEIVAYNVAAWFGPRVVAIVAAALKWSEVDYGDAAEWEANAGLMEAVLTYKEAKP